jgi:CBS domain-containing protein
MVLELLKRVLSNSKRISFTRKQAFQSLPSLVESLNVRFFIQTTLMVTERAKDFETLGRIHDQINNRCMELISSGGSAEDLHLILRHLRERIIHRIIALCHREMRRFFRRSPSKYAWFLAGSEGRGEPSFFTDQDNLIVYARGEKEKVRDYFRILSEKINDRLSQVGFEACKGGVMAKNDEWRGSLKDWEERLQIGFSSLGKDLSENLKTLMFLSVLLDARFFVGDRQLSEDFLSMVLTKARANHRFMGQMARIATRQKVAITFLGRLKLVDEGEHHHALDIKRAGILPLVNSIRLLALKYRAEGPGTIERTRNLERVGVLEPDMSKEIQEGFYLLSRTRLLNQMRNLRAGQKGDDFVAPSELREEDQETLRRALSTVERVKQRVYKDFYLVMETAGTDVP